jgi:hypothetical protein
MGLVDSIRMSSSLKLRITLVAVACAAGALHAAPREATLGGGKATGGPIMSMAQLRSCLAQQDRLKALSDEAVKAQEQMNADRLTIEREGNELRSAAATVDRTSKDAVDAYAARAQAHNSTVEAYQARVPAFNAKVESFQADKAAYAKACENRRYLEDDLKDIKSGK